MRIEEIVQSSVLDAITNDYEDFAAINHEVSRWAVESGLSLSEQDIRNGLSALLRLGWARAYKIDANSLPEDLHLRDVLYKDVSGIYFYATPEGRASFER